VVDGVLGRDGRDAHQEQNEDKRQSGARHDERYKRRPMKVPLAQYGTSFHPRA